MGAFACARCWMLAGIAWLAVVAGCAARGSQPAWSQATLPELAMPEAARSLVAESARYQLTLAGMSLAFFELAQQPQAGWVVISGQTKPDGLGTLFDQLHREFVATARYEGPRITPTRFLAKEPLDGQASAVEHIEVVYTTTGADVLISRAGLPPVVETQALTSRHRFDLGSFLFALRWLDLGAGQQVFADVFRGRLVWRTQLTMAGTTSLTTEVGTFRATRYVGRSRRLRRDGTVDPTAGERTYDVWISDDADRVLLKLSAVSDLGAIELALVQYGQP